MLVYNENQKEAFKIFKETCDKSQYVSFDCEMTGLNLATKTDGTQYDTQEFRYYKQKRVVSELDLVQIGITFYQEQTKDIKTEENIHSQENAEKKENPDNTKKKSYYLERTFLFYLFKNSKFKLLQNKIFDSELTCHPASLKFLSENKFDFNILIKKGIHYNKLKNKQKIEEAINEQKILLSNGAMFLSKENENKLIEKIRTLASYVLENDTRKELDIDFENKQLMIYFLGCNFKKLFLVDNFTVMKKPGKEMTLCIKKTKEASLQKFNNTYTSLDGFITAIKNSPNKIYSTRYQLGCFFDKDKIEELVDEELGFSLFIDYLSKKQIPIIGHNIYFDMMFIYDKLIGDLPEDFYSYKKEVHAFFPKLYDTKAISTKLEKYEKTGLNDLYKNICKNKYDSYIPFFPDARNGFCLYNDMERDKLHDAGYDSIITGRCFVLMNKALQNKYEITDVKKAEHGVGNKIINEEKGVIVDKGFMDISLFEKYINISIMSLVDVDIEWDTEKHNKKSYEGNEKKLVEEKFKNVFMVKFKKPADGHLISVYDIAYTFQNDDYDIKTVKTDLQAAFLEIISDDYYEQQNYSQIQALIDDIKQKKNEDSLENENAEKCHLDIEEVYPSEKFFNNFREIIKLN